MCALRRDEPRAASFRPRTSIAQPRRRHGFAPFQVEGHAEMLLLYATEVLRYFSLEF